MPKIYEVGGCVRDSILGLEPKDRDYVVVGATHEWMLEQGFLLIEATSFPVYHHPITREEHALARTERKSGAGYHGFVVNADPSVTLEDDLRRRDLTINSMARDLDTGQLIDPFNGKDDLENGRLRHTSEAFAEDPLRVLRVARFAARYGDEFCIVQATLDLMASLVNQGEMETLTTERVWRELEKALMEKSPSCFPALLQMCGAWDRLFPEINLMGMAALDKAAEANLSFDERFAALLTETFVLNADNVFARYKASAELARLVHNVDRVQMMSSMGMSHFRVDPLGILKSVDAYRRPEGLKQVCNVLRCLNYEAASLADELEMAYNATVSVSFATLADQTLTGAAVGKAIDAERQKILSALTFTS